MSKSREEQKRALLEERLRLRKQNQNQSLTPETPEQNSRDAHVRSEQAQQQKQQEEEKAQKQAQQEHKQETRKSLGVKNKQKAQQKAKEKFGWTPTSFSMQTGNKKGIGGRTLTTFSEEEETSVTQKKK